jgi:hypothetical protein
LVRFFSFQASICSPDSNFYTQKYSASFPKKSREEVPVANIFSYPNGDRVNRFGRPVKIFPGFFQGFPGEFAGEDRKALLRSEGDDSLIISPRVWRSLVFPCQIINNFPSSLGGLKSWKSRISLPLSPSPPRGGRRDSPGNAGLPPGKDRLRRAGHAAGPVAGSGDRRVGPPSEGQRGPPVCR